MGKILDIFHQNEDKIVESLSQNLSKIVDLLQEKGVFIEEETRGFQHGSPFTTIQAIIFQVEANGYYTEFADALTETGHYWLAELVRPSLWIKRLEDVTITADENLILACELSAECKNIKWNKTDGALSYKANITDFKIADSNAHKYQLEINHVKIEDAGEYNCYCHEKVTTTCNVTVKEMKIDASSKTTTVLHELCSAQVRLNVKRVEISTTIMGLNRAEIEIEERKLNIAERQARIESFRIRLRERQNELENNENNMKELKEKNQQLTEFVTNFGFKVDELDSAKNQWEQMKKKIAILEGEKQDLEGRVSTLEKYINDRKTNDQQQKILEDIRTMMEEQRKSKMCSIS